MAFPSTSPWGKVESCNTICPGVFSVTTASGGGIMVSRDLADIVLSPAAQWEVSEFHNGYLCYEEEYDAAVVFRELIDRETFNAPGRSDVFEQRINSVLQRWHPDYYAQHQLPKRLFVDMDGTLARFHDEVHYLERMFEEGFFRDLVPFYEMVDGLKLFIQQHPDVEVFVLSSKVDGEPPYCEKEKNEWLDKYLPEIDKTHRLFPPVGTPKASVVPGGVTKSDYLLDDYNRGLEAFALAGGTVVKCHNNINQMGLGRHGGDRGKRWTGKMVHTTDFPDMISAELAQHMGLPYDLDRAAEVYGVVIEHNSTDAPYAFHRLSEKNDGSYSALGTKDTVLTFCNPLNAIRACSAYRRTGFDEVKPPCGSCLTKNQVLDLAFNAGIQNTPTMDDPAEMWLGLSMKLQLDTGMIQEAEMRETMEKVYAELHPGLNDTVSRQRRQEIIDSWNNETNDPETQEWRDDLTPAEEKFAAKLDKKYADSVEHMASDILAAEARKMTENTEKKPAESTELNE